MAEIIRMPEVLAGAREATIATWLVREGTRVSEGATLAEAETEKAVVELPLEHSGVVGKLLVGEGESVQVGDPIAVILESADEEFQLPNADGAATEPPSESGTIEPPVPEPLPHAEPSVDDSEMDDSASEPRPAEARATRKRIFASPLVRKIARTEGVDLEQLQGSGPKGRIVRRDLDDFLLERAREAERDPSIPGLEDRPSTEPVNVPHTGMRRAIARRLTESQSSVPHFYLRAGCHVDRLQAIRDEINAVSSVRVSLNDLVIRAVAVAYRDVPEANVIWTEDSMVRFSAVDIAVAVATDKGLVTPVARDVAAKPIRQLSTEIADLVSRGRAGRLRQHELEGGTLTVSNLGMYGIDEFAAIINPPHSGILAVGTVGQEPVAQDGEVVIRSTMHATLSADHRAIDGALAARWLQAFVDAVENPMRLLV